MKLSALIFLGLFSATENTILAVDPVVKAEWKTEMSDDLKSYFISQKAAVETAGGQALTTFVPTKYTSQEAAGTLYEVVYDVCQAFLTVSIHKKDDGSTQIV